MIEDISEGQAKDIILRYCVEKGNGIISSTELKSELFPEFSIDIVNLLLQKIGNAIDPIATVRMDSRTKYITTNGVTEMFLNQGGFTQSEKDEELRKERDLKKESENREKELLEIANLKLQKEASEYQLKIRDKEDKIRDLTTDNLRLGNWDIRFRWLIAVITFLIGFLVKYFIDN